MIEKMPSKTSESVARLNGILELIPYLESEIQKINKALLSAPKGNITEMYNVLLHEKQNELKELAQALQNRVINTDPVNKILDKYPNQANTAPQAPQAPQGRAAHATPILTTISNKFKAFRDNWHAHKAVAQPPTQQEPSLEEKCAIALKGAQTWLSKVSKMPQQGPASKFKEDAEMNVALLTGYTHKLKGEFGRVGPEESNKMTTSINQLYDTYKSQKPSPKLPETTRAGPAM